MDRSLSVHTPESIAFSYDLAGLGSRFLAVFVDLLIQIAIVIAILFGLSFASAGAPHTVTGGVSKLGESLAQAFLAILGFIVFFGYFIVFEAFWNGQTPGKRLLGLRVVRDGGYPIDFASSAIRNLIRVGEAVFLFYLISAIASLVSPENKRLGDLAAGTIVVRSSRIATLDALLAQSNEGPRSPMITPKEYAVIDQFVARRASLAPSVRLQLAMRIADQIRSRVPSDLQRLDDEEMLVRLSEP